MRLSGEAVGTVADYRTIFILIVVPIGAIDLFWMVDILREKIAHRRGHPQFETVRTLCLLLLLHVLELAKRINTQFDLIGIRNERPDESRWAAPGAGRRV